MQSIINRASVLTGELYKACKMLNLVQLKKTEANRSASKYRQPTFFGTLEIISNTVAIEYRHILSTAL